MYESWEDAADIDVNRLLKFYEYNGFFDQLPQILSDNPEKYKDASFVEMPAEDVESFTMYYFDIDQEYLHTADNYSSDANCYSFSIESGIGGGSGLELEQVQNEEQKTTFHCKDMSGNKLVLSVKIEDADHFKYLSMVCE